MSRWTPCKRRDFIKRLLHLGFEGPFSGSRHQFMIYENHRLAIPSNNEFSVEQIKMMIHEVEGIILRKVTLKEWNDLS